MAFLTRTEPAKNLHRFYIARRLQKPGLQSSVAKRRVPAGQALFACRLRSLSGRLTGPRGVPAIR